MSDMRLHHITPSGMVRLETLAEALAARARGGYLWVDCFQPSREELAALSGPFGIHAMSVEDCLDQDQIPKLEDFPRYSFILFNAFSYDGRKLLVDEVDIILSEDCLITVSGNGPGKRRLLEDAERPKELELAGVRRGPAFLMHVLLDHVVDRKFAAVAKLEEQLNRAEESMLAELSRFKPGTLLRLRRDILTLRKSLFHEREILVKICRKDSRFIDERAIYHYRDIYDHLAKFFELTESYREVVTSLMEMYLSMVNNQMARLANDTNVSVRRLTLITTIFMPMTLIAGIGGMSEWSMMTGPSNWQLAYPAFLAAMALMGAVNYWFLKRLEARNRSGS